jgi:hypothetical protein
MRRAFVPALLLGAWGLTCFAGSPPALPDSEDDRPVWKYDADAADCSFSPDGKKVVIAYGKEATVLDAATGKARYAGIAAREGCPFSRVQPR